MIPMRPSLQSRLGLIEIINRCPRRNLMVEVGCFAGESTAIFAQSFAIVNAVDPFAPGYDETDGASAPEELQQARVGFDSVLATFPNIRHIAKPSVEAATSVTDKSMDLVYLDGCHTKAALLGDIAAWLGKIKAGGILAGHDYTSLHLPGVKEAVDSCFSDTVTIHADGSWSKVLQ